MKNPFFRLDRSKPSACLTTLLIVWTSAPSLLAVDYTWTRDSAATHDWSSSANWDANGVFVGGNANNLAFFADTTTALANGSNLITTNVPSALTLRSLVLRGLGADSLGPSNITIGTNASTWTMDRSDAGNAFISLDGMAGTQGLNYTIASNITLVNDSLTVQGNGTAGFNFTGNLTRAGRAFRKEGTSAVTFSGTITGSADFEVYGGTLNVTGNLHTSTTAGKVTARGTAGIMNLSGTVFAGTAGLGVEGTNAQMNITGGTTTVTGNAVFIAPDSAQTGTLNVSGGTLVATGKNLWIGADGFNGATDNSGNGVLSISGTGLLDTGTSTTGTFRLGANRTGSNSTGTLNLDGGTLAVNRSIVFGSKANSGTFNFNGGTFKANGTSATLSATTSGRVNVRNGGAVIDSNGFNITFGEELQHSNIGGDAATDGGLTKKGNGLLTLAATNTYTGVTTIEAGGLRITRTTALYNGDSASWTAANLNIRNGGLLALNVGGTGEFSNTDVTTLLTNLAASTGSTNGMNAGSSLGFDTTNAAGGFTIGDTLANTTGAGGGARGFQKFGSNTLTLTGTNTYTGGTTVHGGTLVIGNASAIGSGSLTVATTANTTLQAGTDLSGTNALDNQVVLGVNTRIDGAENLELSGNITRNNVGLYKYGAGTLTLSGIGSGGTGDLETYAGTMSMTGSWGTALSAGKITARGAAGGVLNWSGTGFAGGAYGLGAEEAGGIINITGGSLSSAATVSAVFIAPWTTHASEINISGGTLAVTSNGAIRIGAGGYNGSTANGVSSMTVSGTGLVDTGTTTGIFGIGSSVAGNTVGTGTLNLDAGGTVATNRTISSGTVANGTFNFNGGTFKANGSSAGISLNASLGRANVRDGGALIDTNGFDITLDQGLAHSNIGGDSAIDGGLTKSGGGNLNLTGVSDYTGSTTVSTGSLEVSGSGAINSTSGVSIASGATFRYNSSVAYAGGAITNDGGTITGAGVINASLGLNSLDDKIAPGNSPGVQSYTTSQTWSSFTYQWEVNDWTSTTPGTGFDQIALTGSLSLSGTTYGLELLSLTAGNAAGDVTDFSEIDRTWTILSTSDGITGFSSGNWSINSSGFTSSPGWDGSFALGLSEDGRDLLLTYTPIPEPNAAVMIGAGFSLVTLLRRRRIC
jgi:autotransporter-associated beta strand protein